MVTRRAGKTKRRQVTATLRRKPWASERERAVANDSAATLRLQHAATSPAGAPTSFLGLQRSYGNQAVGGLIQAKLKVGAAGDKYEREADRVAGQVLAMQVPAKGQGTGIRGHSTIQRGDESQAVQTRPLAALITPIVQRQDEEEEVQAKRAQRQAEGSFAASASLESRLAANKGGGSPLPGSVREFMEPRFGTDFSGVRVHTGVEAMQMNRELKSQAFTHGQDIYMGADRYDRGSTESTRLLAHELTHTIQQGAAPRIRRWGPMGTSHSKVTQAALEAIDDQNALEFYSKKRIKRYISQCAADMDNRESAKPSGRQILQGLMSMLKLQKVGVPVKYPVYTPMGGKWERKRGKKSLFPWRKRDLAERVRAWENVEGYTRVETEQENHAESGMYRLNENTNTAGPRTRERAKLWLKLAVNAGMRQVEAETEGATPNWNDAFLRLGLALHTIEDIGAHGHGVPDWGRHQRGHDPRRFVKPPYYEALSTYGREYRPQSCDLYREGASFGDCDNASKNPGGYDLSVSLAKKTLEGFANKFVGIKPRLKSKGLRKLLGGWLPTWMPKGQRPGTTGRTGTTQNGPAGASRWCAFESSESLFRRPTARVGCGRWPVHGLAPT